MGNNGFLREDAFVSKAPSRTLPKTGSGCFLEKKNKVECQISKKDGSIDSLKSFSQNWLWMDHGWVKPG